MHREPLVTVGPGEDFSGAESARFRDATPVQPPQDLAPQQAAAPVERSAPRVPPAVEQRNIARFLAGKYRQTFGQMQEIVSIAYKTGHEVKVDPLLLLAVAGVESRFDPEAESDRGAQGLMQVNTNVHADKFAPFGGVSAAFDPIANMKVGAKILKGYLRREGSVEGALKSYVGAADLAHDNGYGAKVLSERARLVAVAGKAPR